MARETDDDLTALRAKLVAVRSMGMRREFPSSGNDDEAPRWVVSEVIRLKAIERGSPWSRLHELSFEVTPCVWAVIDNGQRLVQVSAADARRDAALAQFDQPVLVVPEETEGALVNYARSQQSTEHLFAAAKAAEGAAKIALAARCGVD